MLPGMWISSNSLISRNRAVSNELPYRMLVPEGVDNLPDGRALRLDDP